MFCKSRGTQTAAEQAVIQTERERDAGADLGKTLSDSIGLTVVMAVFSAVVILAYGFEDGDGMAASATAIVLSAIVCGIKWFFEIKNRIRWKREAEEKWKREAEEKAKGSDRRVL